MIRLVKPAHAYLKSYTEAFDAYQLQGISTYGMTDPRSCDIFQKYENYRQERNLPSNRVGADYYWLVDDEQAYFIGEIVIRHCLNDALFVRGGHIGYVVRHDEWNKGYATLMLKLALEKAKERGLTRVLLTCNDTNLASATVIEKNGFLFENKVEVDGILSRRYWKEI